MPPEGQPARTGTLDDGAVICRYWGKEHPILDVIVHRNGSWEIVAYSESEELRRRISAGSIRNGVPETVELKAYEAWDYTLRMRLISAEKIN